MNSNDILLYVIVAIIALGLWATLLYYIIKEAISSSNQKVQEELKVQNRFIMLLLLKKEVTGKDLLDIHHETPEQFWARINTVNNV